MPTWAILREALRHAPAETRRTIGWLLLSSVAMLALQVWDVRNAPGPSGAAELLSVSSCVGGVMILALTTILNAGGASLSESRASTDDLTPMLRALPPLAFLSGTLLAAGVALFVARGLLGLHPVRVIAPATVLCLALYAAWRTVQKSTALLFAHGVRQSARAAQASADLQAARFEALQARMEPHFLFNALNTVAALVRTNPEAAERTVEDLSAILRSTLAREGRTTWPLKDELSLVRSFAGVEQRRLGERLRVTWSIDQQSLDVLVPVMSLQPLAENAIKHGVAARIDGGDIAIETRIRGGDLCVIVRDSGDGFASTWKEGTGLGNLRRRLASLYGPRATLTVSPHRPATVTFTVPIGPRECREC